MKYSKPTVTLLGNAVQTIRFVPKHGSVNDGTPDMQDKYTLTPAYDLDE